MTRMIAFALAALAIAGTAAPSALAETKTSHIAVSYSDLNLGSPDGARTLLSRLDAASKQVCGNEYNRSLMERRTERACIKRATANAVAKLNAPMVLALFAEPKSFKTASR
jgi:UrcA family protein